MMPRAFKPTPAFGLVDAARFGLGPAKTASYNAGALQDAVDAAASENTELRLPPGDMSIDAAVNVGNFGQGIRGAGWASTIIRRTGTGNAFFINPTDTDPVLGGPIASGITFSDMQIIGPGHATSQGSAISATEDQWNGDYLRLERMRVHYFDIGVKLAGFAHTQMMSCLLSWCNTNIRSMTPAANTMQLINTTVSRAQVVGVEFYGSHQGVTYLGGEHAEQPMHVKLTNVNGGAPQVTWIGSNAESCTGSVACVEIETNGVLIAQGLRFLKSTSDIPRFKVHQNAALYLSGIRADGAFTTATVQKAAGSAVVVSQLPFSNLGDFGYPTVVEDDGIEEHTWSAFPTRLDNQVPTAAAHLRGSTLFIPTRASQNASDKLLQCVRKADGSYGWFDMIAGAFI